MFGEENDEQNLKAFEAALRSLRPRADRLDPALRAELAAQAKGPHPLPLSQRERGETPGPLSPSERVGTTGPLSLWERVRVRALGAAKTSSCTNPSGHLFLCIYCGSDAVQVRGAGRWAWPAALSTVTAVAAILLAMLVTRSEPPIALRGGQQGAATRSPSVVQQPAHPAFVENGRMPEDQLARGSVGAVRQIPAPRRCPIWPCGIKCCGMGWNRGSSRFRLPSRQRGRQKGLSAIENNWSVC